MITEFESTYFLPSTFYPLTEYALCVRPFKYWGYSSEHDRHSLWPHGTYSWGGESMEDGVIGDGKPRIMQIIIMFISAA